MNISTALLQEIIAFLTPLPCFKNENAWTALLISSGLRDLLSDIENNVTPGVFVSLAVNHLDRYGEKDGEPALLLLLRGVQEKVGTDKQAELQEFEARVNAEWASNPQRKAKRQKRAAKIGVLAFAFILVIIFRFYDVLFPPTPQPSAPPLFAVERPYLRPDQPVTIIAANESARRKAPLYVNWDDLIFPNAATPDPDPQAFRWTFDLKQHIPANELQNGRHALQVGFAADAFCPVLHVAINGEQPIADVAITSKAADEKSVTIGGIAASVLQDPAETLKIDVFFNFNDNERPILLTLPVERKLDDEGRIYFEFEADIQGLPTIAADDPKYAAPFFAFKVSDQAGNEFAHTMSYAQFVAPGTQRIKANDMADIQVQKFADGLVYRSDSERIDTIAFVVAPPLAEYRGKPAIRLDAELHGENMTRLSWVSELSQAAGHPVPTFVFRNDRHLSVVVNGEEYVDKNPPKDRDAQYKVRQFDENGQPYDSNLVTIPAKVTPTPQIAATTVTRPPTCWDNETRGATCKEETTGMEFVFVPGGCFQMGCGTSDTECYDNEKPRHEVCLDGFWMGKFEVTQARWEAVMKNNPSKFKGADRPVEMVSWNDAQEFLSRLRSITGKRSLSGAETRSLSGAEMRLPSEAEWEYAARAGTETAYAFGDDPAQLDQYAWYAENSGDQPHPVGQKQPNAFGLYDMHGNVWEWVTDTYHNNYDGAPMDGSAWESGGSNRVLRGGSWYSEPRGVRSAFRIDAVPAIRNVLIGFRVARTK